MKYLIMTMIAMMFCSANYKVGYYLGYKTGQLESLPTQSEVQEILGVEIDGVVGKTTRDVWDTFVCDRFAMPYMLAFQEEVDRVYGFDIKPLKEME